VKARRSYSVLPMILTGIGRILPLAD